MARSRIAAIARRVLVWAAASGVTAVLSALVQTGHTVTALRGHGLPVDAGQALGMAGQDLLHFVPFYGAIVAAGFLIAFLVTAGLRRWRPLPAVPIHALAGAVAVLTALQLMNHLLGLALIPATLEPAWLAVLVLCGGAGGALYGRWAR